MHSLPLVQEYYTVHIFARFGGGGGGACHLHVRSRHKTRGGVGSVCEEVTTLCMPPLLCAACQNKGFFLGENFLRSPHSFRPKKRLVKGVIRDEKSCRCVASAANTTCALEKGAEACKSLSSKKKEEE